MLWRKKPKTFIGCAYPVLEIDEARVEVVKSAAIIKENNIQTNENASQDAGRNGIKIESLGE